jgi:hypothetical protein
MHLRVGGRWYYLVSLLDEHPRFLVHYELLTSMDGNSVSLATRKAIETLAYESPGRPIARPDTRTDDRCCCTSRELRTVLSECKLIHQRVKSHCPTKNSLLAGAYHALHEPLDGQGLPNRLEAE